MPEKLILHEDPMSGNCYKIRLAAGLLGIRMERVAYDIMKGETRTPEFLAHINPVGRIPVLQVGRRFLPESNAACVYLADGSALVPADRFDRADMLRWMFFEQYHHEPNIATVRFWLTMVGNDALSELQRNMIPGKRIAGEAALQQMEDHLSLHDWFVGDAVTLADIALFAYTHVADEGGFDLALYPHIGAWIDRVAALPRFVSLRD
ncbi:glutathione S-transferase family protein [Hephaestia sp. GCM10023244]|uniref:glutathione S-transferase family protein n=1 Tax=unclassified Hephaestia TaxID=2631281 RepID=UPI0020775675|nr:glutathione S-transferase family protein [Hephaestia sp. MAHUQ-44]MCM8729633.1 glutathione S-transferase family protein [Hephaestia sp. MAHUQ-44]